MRDRREDCYDHACRSFRKIWQFLSRWQPELCLRFLDGIAGLRVGAVRRAADVEDRQRALRTAADGDAPRVQVPFRGAQAHELHGAARVITLCDAWESPKRCLWFLTEALPATIVRKSLWNSRGPGTVIGN